MGHHHPHDERNTGRRRAADVLRWLGCQALAALMAALFVTIMVLTVAGR